MVAVSFQEPGLSVLLTLLSFFYLLQVGRTVAQHLVGAGLLGEIAVGIIYQVAHLLSTQWEETFLPVGFIGLVLIVFEGGLEFDRRLFLQTLPIATVSAVTGILLPIAFTFALFSAFAFPRLHAFSAGVALASTSLGTTFYVLRAQSGPDLSSTRISSILISAALVDDILALVLLSVLTSLGGGGDTALGWTIGRPLLASVGVALVGPAVAFLVAGPLFRRFGEARFVSLRSNAALFLGVAVLSAFLAICDTAGTTVLLGAFLAGVFLSALPSEHSSINFKHEFDKLIGAVQNYFLAPLFFASIGYTIPFVRLWQGRIIWRGICYALLMTLGKLLVGLWVVFVDSIDLSFGPPLHAPPAVTLPVADNAGAQLSTQAEKTSFGSTATLVPSSSTKTRRRLRLSFHCPTSDVLPPAVFLGTALVARGEIGVLVLQVAYNSPGGLIGEEAYLVAIWAVALCTIVGPIAFGAIVRRYGSSLVGGRWGVSPMP